MQRWCWCRSCFDQSTLWNVIFFFPKSMKHNERHLGVLSYLVFLTSNFRFFFSLISYNMRMRRYEKTYQQGIRRGRGGGRYGQKLYLTGVIHCYSSPMLHILGSCQLSAIVCSSSWNWQTVLPTSAPIMMIILFFYYSYSSGDVRLYHVGRGLTFSSLCIKNKN